MSESSLSREEVLKIARLARLELSDEEVSLYQQRLGRVIGYVNELNEVSTEKRSAVKHVPRDAVAIREDRPIEFPSGKDLMENAPAQVDNHFLVPAVIEQG